MEKRTVGHIIALVEHLDERLKDAGFERDNCIDLTYKDGPYTACLTIYPPKEEEDNG